MIDQVPLAVVVALTLVGFAAGWIDAVVGGGGVLQLPALLIGLPSSTAVPTVSGTNKLSSIAGTFAASATYVRRVRIAWPTALLVVVFAYAGSTLGARLVTFMPRVAFTPVIIVAVAAVGLYTWRRPQLGQTTHLRHAGRASHWLLAVALGAVCGVWDGLVGPGTGIFLVIGFAALLGYGFLEATAMSKLANLATNAAALLVLGTQGHVLWGVGACMAAANLTGGLLGSHMAITRGNRFIRQVLLLVIVGVEAKLLYDLARLVWA
ncbi:MAG: TSUP family transporter [Actinomycetia bacterium]|nr:TSUP family transporter [Actinomycetes bacterium]